MLKVHVTETPSSRPQSSCYVHQSSCCVIRKLLEFPLRLMVLHDGIITMFNASVPHARYVIAMSLLHQCYVVGVACMLRSLRSLRSLSTRPPYENLEHAQSPPRRKSELGDQGVHATSIKVPTTSIKVPATSSERCWSSSCVWLVFHGRSENFMDVAPV